MKILKKIYYKDCHWSCERLSEAYDEINKLEADLKNKQAIDSAIDVISEFQKTNEHIVYLAKSHMGLICVTKLDYYDYTGKTRYFDFIAYEIGKPLSQNENMCTLNAELIYDKNKNISHAFIVDIVGTTNQGYGSLIMKQFLKYIKHSNIRYVTGSLSNVDLFDEYDSEHKDRLYHFYQKFDFEIKPDKTIFLNLKS